MGPRPYSERAALPDEPTLGDSNAPLPTQVLAESPSPSTLSAATTPSPTPQEVVVIEPLGDNVDILEGRESQSAIATVPCYPTPDDIMPYDHSLPDFIRQITNQSNLANLHSLSLRVISTLISLHRMSTYLPNLRELDLEGSVLNSLRDIGCSLKNLQILKVGRCQLESLDGTFGLTSLRELYAQKNLINDVSPCSNLPHIRHVDVSGNRIRNISYAGFLSVCSKLKSIVFTGNPATEVSSYRNHVRRILPQIEILDGIPFLDDDNAEIIKEQEIVENICEGSDSDSAEVSHFSNANLSGNDFLKSQEDDFPSDKNNKRGENVAIQDQYASSRRENQEPLTNKTDFSDKLKNLNLQQGKLKRGPLEASKITESINSNIKQKCASIQKLDKDIENRSKKSNLMLNSNFTDELLSQVDCMPSTSASNAAIKKPEVQDTNKGGNSEMRPTTACGAITKSYLDNSVVSHSKFGTVRKKPLTPVPESTVSDNKGMSKIDYGVSKLTTGLPVCGNLTAALRNRKKIQDSWNEREHLKMKNIKSRNDQEEERNKDLLIQLNGSGDTGDFSCSFELDDDLIQEDVLATSQKWREEFRRYRSNNRARWEEEDPINYSEGSLESIVDLKKN